MYAQVDKKRGNKSQAVANSVAQKKSDVKQCFGFVDNRSAALHLKKLQETAENNLRHADQLATQFKGNNGQAEISTGDSNQFMAKREAIPDPPGSFSNATSAEPVQRKPTEALGASMSARRGPIQRKWVPYEGKDTEGKLMKWDKPIDNKTWFCVEGKDLLFYQDNLTKSEKKPYLQWLQEGWLGLTDSALARDAKRNVQGGVNPRPETTKESYTKMVNQGKALYASMGHKNKLSKPRKEWQQYKSDKMEPDNAIDPVTKEWGIKVVVKTGFKDTYFNRLLKDTGHYQNYFYFPSGTIVASSNYRAQSEEKEPLTNNEVIYHQLLEAAKVAKQKPQVKTLIRDHVVNKTLQPIIRQVRKDRGNGDLKFTPKDPIFFVLLATPNVKAGVFLVNDRGHLIGIKTITELVLLKKGSVEIHFG
ncbi:hypothetical protein D0962_19185 [Leptolyngbyaceae cyanobacterium CCMR0082]|uniref:Uncharacterized protein n=1 Tax=Adonisia turfae CCMR0082 TaxID=2304604 RepID=A0A6M0S997_9CYAN|nr:hypothetical protein [Adonisia turfae]MDV3348658.1 hypothetical protein [Leptothoe sp. LEGE 181152]NEZ64886.1 hypothetical protein [Adonisia turfae CCMR0082]